MTTYKYFHSNTQDALLPQIHEWKNNNQNVNIIKIDYRNHHITDCENNNIDMVYSGKIIYDRIEFNRDENSHRLDIIQYMNDMLNSKITLLTREERTLLICKIGLIDKHNSNFKTNRITYIKNIKSLNDYLDKLNIRYRIKEFETSRMIDGQKKKFKNAWKIVKI